MAPPVILVAQCLCAWLREKILKTLLLTPPQINMSDPETSDPRSDPSKVVDIYNCLQCSHRIPSVFQLEHHIQRKHKNVYAAELFHAIVEPEQFRCICCDYKSYYQFELYEHSKQTHNPKAEGNEDITFCEEFARYPCEYCSHKSDSALSLIKHHKLCEDVPKRMLRDSTTGQSESVESLGLNRMDVGISSDVHSIISAHDSREKVNMFECNHCSYRAKQKTRLRVHMLKHSTNKKINWFQCNHCSYRAKQKCHLKMHILKHSTNKEIDWFQCNHCSYRTARKSNLKTHMLKHSTDEEINWFQCNHCPCRTKYKAVLDRHMLRHSTNEEINWSQCNQCSFRTKRKSYLKTHMLRRHSTARSTDEFNRFQCNHCSYRAKQKFHLKMHMVKHSTDEEIDWLQCNYCSYRTARKSCFKRHMLRHATNKEINWSQCNQCSFRTKRKSYLKTHMLRRHSTARSTDEFNRFQCNHCSYRAKQKSYLKKHMLKHV